MKTAMDTWSLEQSLGTLGSCVASFPVKLWQHKVSLMLAYGRRIQDVRLHLTCPSTSRTSVSLHKAAGRLYLANYRGLMRFWDGDQAGNPAWRLGYPNVLFFLGKDSTKEALGMIKSFFSGYLRAGRLGQQSTMEGAGVGRELKKERASPFAGHLFPYYDLFPCPETVEFDACMKFTDQYLGLVKPVVVVTYSYRVSSMAAGKFLHGYGTAHKVSPAKSVFCFWPSMTGDGLMEMLRTISGHSTSCGSLLSSRRDKYDYSPVEFQRIIDLISIIGFKIADLAVEILAADMSRKMLCEMIRANYALLSANYSMDMLVFWDESSTNNRCTYQKFGYSPEGSPLKA